MALRFVAPELVILDGVALVIGFVQIFILVTTLTGQLTISLLNIFLRAILWQARVLRLHGRCVDDDLLPLNSVEFRLRVVIDKILIHAFVISLRQALIFFLFTEQLFFGIIDDIN